MNPEVEFLRETLKSLNQQHALELLQQYKKGYEHGYRDSLNKLLVVLDNALEQTKGIVIDTLNHDIDGLPTHP